MSRIRVSVIIPVHDGERYMAEAIRSVLDQSLYSDEVIVVDDGSEDATGEIARSFPGVRCVRQDRAGQGAARNLGLELSTGTHIAMLDADDRFPPHRNELLAEALARDSGLDAAFGRMREFVSPDTPDPARIRPPAEAIPWTLASTGLIAREVFDRVGPFSTDLRAGVGVEWYTRMVEADLRTAMLDDVVLERRLHARNTAMREAGFREQYLRVLKAALDRRRGAAT